MRQTLQSWGRYPAHQQDSLPLNWRDDIAANLVPFKDNQQTTLVFGNGRSYGDSCLAASDRVLHAKPLDRWIKADWDNGIIVAEAGVTLAEILAFAIPRGWFLPVTPGTKYVTLGGAVANDVHGKNHHVRGTFCRYVREFGLIRSDVGFLTCSPSVNADYFKATIGGLGLTGVITYVELALMPIKSSQLHVKQIRFDTLSEFFALSTELDPQYEYSVAWVDCLSKQGRGIFSAGNHAESGALQVSGKRKIKMPLTPPMSLMNRLTLKLFNQAYFHAHSEGCVQKDLDYDTFFYPLDSILEWNKLYGPKGFQQFQCIIPSNNAEDGIKDILSAIAKSGQGSFLAVLKRSGDLPSPGLLSFPMPGTSLALDFSENRSHQQTLFQELDAIVRATGGRLYPAKDAHMSGSDFKLAYPNWELLETIRDPIMLSRFWKRVTTI